MKSHHDLEVWQSAIGLAKKVYGATGSFPGEETYGLTAQMRRSAVSIASNIAEGAGRQGTKEFIHFLYTACGSANELDTQIEVAKEVGMGVRRDLEILQEQVAQTLKMMRGLIRSLRAREKKQ
jgi:four helix bundle protein